MRSEKGVSIFTMVVLLLALGGSFAIAGEQAPRSSLDMLDMVAGRHSVTFYTDESHSDFDYYRVVLERLPGSEWSFTVPKDSLALTSSGNKPSPLYPGMRVFSQVTNDGLLFTTQGKGSERFSFHIQDVGDQNQDSNRYRIEVQLSQNDNYSWFVDVYPCRAIISDPDGKLEALNSKLTTPFFLASLDAISTELVKYGSNSNIGDWITISVAVFHGIDTEALYAIGGVPDCKKPNFIYMCRQDCGCNVAYVCMGGERGGPFSWMAIIL